MNVAIRERGVVTPSVSSLGALAAQARDEGWGLFDQEETGYVELLRDREAGRFRTDLEAWRLVLEPSDLHTKALSHLCAVNPVEWTRVVTLDDASTQELSAAACGLWLVQHESGWQAQAIPGASARTLVAARGLGVEGTRHRDRGQLAAHIDDVLGNEVRRECGLGAGEWARLPRSTRCRLAFGFAIESTFSASEFVVVS